MRNNNFESPLQLHVHFIGIFVICKLVLATYAIIYASDWFAIAKGFLLFIFL